MKRVLLFFIFFFFFCFVYFNRYQPVSLDLIQPTTKTVEIKGQVENPGVYILKWEATIHDLLKEAGGAKKQADLDAINQSRIVRDGDVIVINEKNFEEVKKISLNSGSLQDFDSLPGIGPAIAQRIIEYRNQHSFQAIEEIMEVKGIGEKMFNKIKDRIIL